MNRFDEARSYNQKLLEKNADAFIPHLNFFTLGFLNGDRAAMEKEAAWFRGKPFEEFLTFSQSLAAASEGRLRPARDFALQSAALSERSGFKEGAATVLLSLGFSEALFGRGAAAKQRADEALKIVRSRRSVGQAASILTLTGDFGRAKPLIDEQSKRFPHDTYWHEMIVPVLRASEELQRKNPARAIEALRPAEPLAAAPTSGQMLSVLYFRGQAHLALRHFQEAAADFQKILHNRGADIYSPFRPLAYVGLARAAALDGDAAKARKAYQDFFALWKDADADIPVLLEAKAEYAKLK
jgi:tetratricopeptide (TPR) repeat protein